MKRNQIWIFGVLTAFCLSGCGIVKEKEATEIQQNIEGLKDVTNELKQTIEDSKIEVAQELNNINWAEEVFLITDGVEKEKLVLTRMDLDTPQTVTETKDFIANMNVKEWKKVDALPENKTPLAVYDVGRTFYVEMDGHHIEKTLILANLVVYDGYAQLEVLDGMTKYLDCLISKDAFCVTYEIENDVTTHLTGFGV